MKSARRAAAVLCALLAWWSCPSSSPAAEPGAPPESFDCEDAFDLIAMTTMLRCAAWVAPPDADARLAAVRRRLLDAGLAQPAEFEGLHIAFCPLLQGTGMLPDPAHLYLDDGLLGMSIDGLAEILAHELQHRVQFASFGSRGFKCGYVRAMSACGGCQDRRHPLEAEAYARQDRARERLLAAPPGGDPR
ncbi:MAG: hypothetical protein AB7I32_08245 [Gammaproteobacteria bacterium]